MEELPKATSPEEIILTDKQEQRYNELVEIIGEDALILIHLKHYKEFLIDLEGLKKHLFSKLFDNLNKRCDKNMVCGRGSQVSKWDIEQEFNRLGNK